MKKLHHNLTLLTAAILLSACAGNTQSDKETDQAALNTPSEPIVVTGARLEQHQPVATDAEESNRQLAKIQYLAERSAVGVAQKHRPITPQPSFDSLAGENYADFVQNGFKDVLAEPVSTFSIDVDTGSYSNMRRILNQGMLPPKSAIRTEELLNYFSYDYQAPATKDQPFLVNTNLMQSPWDADKHLLQVGIKAWEQQETNKRANANLVFLLDVSGSMNQPNKLPLLKQALRMLSKQMSADDRISIVVYAGASGVVLEPTAGNDVIAIETALSNLRAGGSTNGEAGIKLAYQMAEKAFIKDGINRIMLATDGDFNVGQSSTESLVELIEVKRKKGIALSTLGFGSGNYNDHLIEQLADKGNGTYSYIDNLLEARKVLVDELDSQLITVAADVKLQLEFNPQQVAEYRLVGYENRTLAREDFNNDRVDAGEIGAGHTVTAVYELTLASTDKRAIEPLRYQTTETSSSSRSDELGFMRIRYKNPGETSSQLIETPLRMSELVSDTSAPTHDSLFSAAVIAFADKLRGGKYTASFSFADIKSLALAGKGDDISGLRAEFGRLIALAETVHNAS